MNNEKYKILSDALAEATQKYGDYLEANKALTIMTVAIIKVLELDKKEIKEAMKKIT